MPSKLPETKWATVQFETDQGPQGVTPRERADLFVRLINRKDAWIDERGDDCVWVHFRNLKWDVYIAIGMGAIVSNDRRP